MLALKDTATYLIAAVKASGTEMFPYLVHFYLQIQDPIILISMSTTYLDSSGADLSENKLFQCVSIFLTGTSTYDNYSSGKFTTKYMYNVFGHISTKS